MKKIKTTTLLLALSAFAFPLTAHAENDAAKDGEKKADRSEQTGKKKCGKHGGKKQRFEKHRAAMLEKFDTDGDGKLSEDERTAARASMKAAKDAFIAQYDSDGDGKLSKDERKVAKDAFITKYDLDGDGKLNEEERKLARDSGDQLGRFLNHGDRKKRCHKGGKRPGKCQKKGADKGADRPEKEGPNTDQ